ncbi:hypothetical protein M3Y99_00698100 [Aphelenchoides fujianensis]|nr:hypothetical protein M3Y99_00698100 [Aphelenchoides fujianensis]
MAPVKPKPRMRAAVRNVVSRFSLLAAKMADENKAATQLVRLAAISRTHLAALRNSIHGVKFEEIRDEGLSLKLDLGSSTPAIELAVARAEIDGIFRLLGVPVHGLKNEQFDDFRFLLRVVRDVLRKTGEPEQTIIFSYTPFEECTSVNQSFVLSDWTFDFSIDARRKEIHVWSKGSVDNHNGVAFLYYETGERVPFPPTNNCSIGIRAVGGGKWSVSVGFQWEYSTPAITFAFVIQDDSH